MRDVAHDLIDQRRRRHLRFADRARCRSIDQRWQYFYNVDANTMQLPPQRQRIGVKTGLGC
jgi:hypothetical protein